MAKLVVTEFLSLDGVMDDPGGSEGTPHGGWTFPYASAEFLQFKLDEIRAAGALLLGRVTYQGFAAAWPGRTDEQGFAERMNSLPKYVVTSSQGELAWNNSHRVDPARLAEEVAQLKSPPGDDILVEGSARLAQALTRLDLVDEYRLLVYPLILGSGKRLFGDGGEQRKLRLVEQRAFQTGVMVLRYARA